MSATIETLQDVEDGLAALVKLDPRLLPVLAAAETVPLRRRPPGFESLAGIIVGQQVSTSSAAAILGRLRKEIDLADPAAMAGAGEEECRCAGLSGPKERALRAVAAAILEDGLDLDALCRQSADDAIAALVAVKGIGPWTAEIYLLFCAGHADIFPAGDLALRHAVGHGLELGAPPDMAATALIAAQWSPWRGVAARLFWSYYAAWKGGGFAPVLPMAGGARNAPGGAR